MRRLALLALLAGCAWVRPALDPAPWDAWGDRGALQVRGAAPGAPGRAVWDAVLRDADVRRRLAGRGEPETIEVLGARFAPKELLLTYRGARRVVVDAAGGGLFVRAADPVSSRRTATRRTPALVARATPAAARCPDCAPAAHAPTLRQELECPIDPDRADCRDLCASDGSREWCRAR